MPQAINEGMFVILFISGPLVILAAALGLAVGIVQAATQIQEQTLGSAIKVIGIFIALIAFGFFMFAYMRKYTSQTISRAFKLIPSLGKYVKARDNFLEHKTEKIAKPEIVEDKIENPEPAKINSQKALGQTEEKAPNIQGPTKAQESRKIPPPKSQIKEKDNNLKSQNLNPPNSSNKEASIDQNKNPPPTEPINKPIPSKQINSNNDSLGDALSKLKNSISEPVH